MKISISRESINAKALNGAMHRHGISTLPKNLSKLNADARHAIMQVIRDERYCKALIGNGKLFATSEEAKSASGWNTLEKAVLNGDIAIVPARKKKSPQAPAIANASTPVAMSNAEVIANALNLCSNGKLSETAFLAILDKLN